MAGESIARDIFTSWEMGRKKIILKKVNVIVPVFYKEIDINIHVNNKRLSY